MGTLREEIAFIQRDNHRQSACANFFQYHFYSLNLPLHMWMRGIDYMYQQIGFCHFFQGGPECCYQRCGQALDKAYRIREQDFLPASQSDSPGCGIERGEEFVLGLRVGASQAIEQG